ncbi:hypothetical protein Tco_0529168 [Tanacetum coccineum]
MSGRTKEAKELQRITMKKLLKQIGTVLGSQQLGSCFTCASGFTTLKKYTELSAIVPAREKQTIVKSVISKFHASIQLQFDFHRAIYNLGTVLYGLAEDTLRTGGNDVSSNELYSQSAIYIAAAHALRPNYSVVHETTSQINVMTNGRRKHRRRRIGRKSKNDVANNRFSGSSVMLLMILCIVDLTVILHFKVACMLEASYEGQDDIQLMRFTGYFRKAFSGVSSSQFMWVKLLRVSHYQGCRSTQDWHTFVTGVGEGFLKGLKKKPDDKSSKAGQAGQVVAVGNTVASNDVLRITITTTPETMTDLIANPKRQSFPKLQPLKESSQQKLSVEYFKFSCVKHMSSNESLRSERKKNLHLY